MFRILRSAWNIRPSAYEIVLRGLFGPLFMFARALQIVLVHVTVRPLEIVRSCV